MVIFMRLSTLFIRLPRYPFLWAILLYQKLLSPDHSFWAKHWYPQGYCPYSPSCSSYGYEVIKKYGVIKGMAKAGWRIVRCNPWGKGGVDLP